MLLGRGEVDGTRVLSQASAELMTQDHLNAETRKSHFLTKNFFSNAGFGFALQLQTSKTAAGPSPGSFWWHGSTGVGWTADPKEEMVFVRLIQNMQSPVPFISDFSAAVYRAIDRTGEIGRKRVFGSRPGD